MKADRLSFEESVSILNDLSFMVVPVDPGHADFKSLLRRIKSELERDESQTTQHNYELVEALSRLRIDAFCDLMRSLVLQKKLSRKSRDITAQLLYFAQLLTTHKQERDTEIVKQLVAELKFLSVSELGAEQVNYLMRGLSMVAEAGAFDGQMAKLTGDFLPILLEHYQSELYRCRIADVLTVVASCEQLRKVAVISEADHRSAHELFEVYLLNYLEKTKRQINGQEFAATVRHVGEAKFHAIHIYKGEVIDQLEKNFTTF